MKIFTYATAILCMFLLPLGVAAATFSLRADPPNIGVGDTVNITLFVESISPLNTFSGTLSYPPDMLMPIAINDGSSIISMWLTRPVLSEDAPLSFAGFTPGGFSGADGKILSVVFKALRSGTVQFSLDQNEVLRNDGSGTREKVVVQPLTLAVSGTSQGGFVESADTFAPEPFGLSRGDDPALFNGDNYLVFSAVDKASGIRGYEIAEKRFPLLPLLWREDTSPYRITDQYLTSDVYVKAIDRAGNERTEVFHRAHILRPYEWILLGMLIVIAFVVRRRIRTFYDT